MPSRRMGREAALQALYAVLIGGREPGAALDEVLGARSDAEQRRFVKSLVMGTLDFATAADAVMTPLLEGWSIERLPSIDLLLLRMGVYELRGSSTPPAVVINEAVELAKKFSTEDSGRFVNGVLSAVAAAKA